MAKLTKKEIEHIALLSRLELTESEKELYANQLSSVLEYVEELGKIDTENVQATANIAGLVNVLREDKIVDSPITHEDIKKNAPEFKGGSFVVPGVFE
jgi:aspartyl-tRNA(Asn)/glutamyl-tRNA(Gln) amidotransferase subunit C